MYVTHGKGHLKRILQVCTGKLLKRFKFDFKMITVKN